MTSLQLIAYSRLLADKPFPEPVVAATITCDAAVLGRLNAEKQLRALAYKMLLDDYEIVPTGQPLPAGKQLPLL